MATITTDTYLDGGTARTAGETMTFDFYEDAWAYMVQMLEQGKDARPPTQTIDGWFLDISQTEEQL